MAEILHHLLSMKPYKKWDILHINWCRILFHQPYLKDLNINWTLLSFGTWFMAFHLQGILPYAPSRNAKGKNTLEEHKQKTNNTLWEHLIWTKKTQKPLNTQENNKKNTTLKKKTTTVLVTIYFWFLVLLRCSRSLKFFLLFSPRFFGLDQRFSNFAPILLPPNRTVPFSCSKLEWLYLLNGRTSVASRLFTLWSLVHSNPDKTVSRPNSRILCAKKNVSACVKEDMLKKHDAWQTPEQKMQQPKAACYNTNYFKSNLHQPTLWIRLCAFKTFQSHLYPRSTDEKFRKLHPWNVLKKNLCLKMQKSFPLSNNFQLGWYLQRQRLKMRTWFSKKDTDTQSKREL